MSSMTAELPPNPACTYGNHDRYGVVGESARWAVIYLEPKPCGCIQDPVYFCEPCLAFRLSSIRTTCLTCHMVNSEVMAAIARIERIR